MSESPARGSVRGLGRGGTTLGPCLVRGILLSFVFCVTLSYLWGYELGTIAATGTGVLRRAALLANSSCTPLASRGVPPFKNRRDLGEVCEVEGFRRGLELGVQRGIFAKETLSRWPSCEEYHLVDLWAPQENYRDIANVGQKAQDLILREAMDRLEEWWDAKIRMCRNYTSVCARGFEEGYFDYIYVDARHDYKGVWEDVNAYWPKLRRGGIMAGHDYVTQNDGPAQTGQNWTANYNGTVDATGTVVKGAVDAFAEKVCRQVTVSYREQSWNSWAIRK